MDVSLPPEQISAIETCLAKFTAQGISYHALRTRQAGRRSFISLHVLVPGNWTVKTGHDWVERIEAELRAIVANCHITTHLEPLEDPASMDDQELDRSVVP